MLPSPALSAAEDPQQHTQLSSTVDMCPFVVFYSCTGEFLVKLKQFGCCKNELSKLVFVLELLTTATSFWVVVFFLPSTMSSILKITVFFCY